MQRFLYHLIRHRFAAGCLLTVAFHLQANAVPVEQERILVLGDSISAAYGMSLEQGWVALLDERLQADDVQAQVVNASISGETTAGGLRRLPALLASHRPSVVLLQLGANDALRGYPLPELRDNLAAMSRAAQEAGAAVVLLPMEIPPNYGQRYTDGFRDSFRSVADETGAALGPFILERFATDPELMQEDGIHPRVAAQRTMLDTVYPTIRSALARP